MTIAGWITMIIALAGVWGLVIWCYRQILKAPETGKVPPGFGP